jgi:hypothetical protein
MTMVLPATLATLTTPLPGEADDSARCFNIRGRNLCA